MRTITETHGISQGEHAHTVTEGRTMHQGGLTSVGYSNHQFGGWGCYSSTEEGQNTPPRRKGILLDFSLAESANIS